MPEGLSCTILSKAKKKNADNAAKVAEGVRLSDDNNMAREKNNSSEAKKKCRKEYNAQYYRKVKQKKEDEAAKVAENVRLSGDNHVARENFNKFMQDRGPLKTFVMHDVLQNNPHLLQRLSPFLDQLFESGIQSENGIIISCDAPCGNYAKPNVDSGKVLRHYYGSAVETEVTRDDQY